MIDFIVDNWGAIATALFAISEVIANIPAVKANSLFQMLYGLLKKIVNKS